MDHRQECYCDACRMDFVVKYELDEDETEIRIEHCPFCGEALEDEMEWTTDEEWDDEE